MEQNEASLRFCHKLGLKFIGKHIIDHYSPMKGMWVHDFELNGSKK